MDENDFDQILQTDFHPNVHTGDHHRLHLEEHHADDAPDVNAEVQQPAAIEEPVIDPTLNDSSSIDPPYESPPAATSAKRVYHGGADSHLTVDEKKRKQREQNRLAASRSRRKKQGALGELEGNVEALQRENERLRARLNALSANQPSSSSTTLNDPATHSADLADTQKYLPGIDHQYFRKVAQDIQYLKEALIGREIDLQRERSGAHDAPIPDDETIRLRGELTQKLANLTMMRSEEKAIREIIRNLVSEKDALVKYRSKIQRDSDARTAVKDINVAARIASGRGLPEGSIEKAFLDVKAWLNETIAKWEEVDVPDEVELPLDPQLNEQTSIATQ